MNATYPLSALTTDISAVLADNQPHNQVVANELTMSLLDVPLNTPVEIADFADADIQLNVCRMGVSVGSLVTVVSRIAGGPLVVVTGTTELAFGRQVCQGIRVVAHQPALTLSTQKQVGV